MAGAWAYRVQLDEKSENMKELKESVLFTADQPSGAVRMMQMAFEAENFKEAEAWVIRAISLNKTSATAYEYYAILLGQSGRSDEALTQLKIAANLEPGNPRFPYLIALTYGELDQKDKVEEFLRKSLELDQNNDRAWYNLGLILAEQDKLDEAIRSIRNAEQIAPQNPAYPYARATIHVRAGDKAAAFEACRTVLGIDREYKAAIDLIWKIGNPNQ